MILGVVCVVNSMSEFLLFNHNLVVKAVRFCFLVILWSKRRNWYNKHAIFPLVCHICHPTYNAQHFRRIISLLLHNFFKFQQLCNCCIHLIRSQFYLKRSPCSVRKFNNRVCFITFFISEMI